MRILSNSGLLAAVAFVIADSRLIGIGHTHTMRELLPDISMIRMDAGISIGMVTLEQSWKVAQHRGHAYQARYKAPHFQNAPVYHQRLAPPSRPPRKGGLCRKPDAFY